MINSILNSDWLTWKQFNYIVIQRQNVISVEIWIILMLFTQNILMKTLFPFY
jgi:hypothetical protein